MITLERRVRRELAKLGIPKKYLGEKYLVMALEMLEEEPTKLCCVSKMLYIDIASRFKTTPAAVERNIRTLATVVWEKAERDQLWKLAGRVLKRKQTNTEFIDMMVAKCVEGCYICCEDCLKRSRCEDYAELIEEDSEYESDSEDEMDPNQAGSRELEEKGKRGRKRKKQADFSAQAE